MAFTRSEKVSLGVVVLLVFIGIAVLPAAPSVYHAAEDYLSTAPILGPLLYIALMVGAILIAPLPASPLAILAGTVFGPWLGMLYTLVAATIGACIAFLIARFLLGDVARNHLKSYAWYKKLAQQDEIRIAHVIALTRLMPQVSFDLISYVAGLTNIRLIPFALATFIGMVPIVFILSFFGAMLQPYQEFMLLLLAGSFIVYCIYKVIKK